MRIANTFSSENLKHFPLKSHNSLLPVSAYEIIIVVNQKNFCSKLFHLILEGRTAEKGVEKGRKTQPKSIQTTKIEKKKVCATGVGWW